MRLRPELDESLRFLIWLAGLQENGKLLLRAFDQGMRLVNTVWLDNRDPRFDRRVDGWLRRWANRRHNILYGVNAFSREEAYPSGEGRGESKDGT